jgi:hypothetical protein
MVMGVSVLTANGEEPIFICFYLVFPDSWLFVDNCFNVNGVETLHAREPNATRSGCWSTGKRRQQAKAVSPPEAFAPGLPLLFSTPRFTQSSSPREGKKATFTNKLRPHSVSF